MSPLRSCPPSCTVGTVSRSAVLSTEIAGALGCGVGVGVATSVGVGVAVGGCVGQPSTCPSGSERKARAVLSVPASPSSGGEDSGCVSCDVSVGVGTGVSVGAGVSVGSGVAVGSGVGVSVASGVLVGVAAASGTAVPVVVAVGVTVPGVNGHREVALAHLIFRANVIQRDAL
jgi:hypothetical protein